MTCKCDDLQTRLAEALAAANKFRAERDELRLKMAEGIRVQALQYGGIEAFEASDGNATLILDDGVGL